MALVKEDAQKIQDVTAQQAETEETEETSGYQIRDLQIRAVVGLRKRYDDQVKNPHHPSDGPKMRQARETGDFGKQTDGLRRQLNERDTHVEALQHRIQQLTNDVSIVEETLHRIAVAVHRGSHQHISGRSTIWSSSSQTTSPA